MNSLQYSPASSSTTTTHLHNHLHNPPTPTPSPSTVSTPLKRTRAKRSCDFCRKRKSRCDADHSIPCSNCRAVNTMQWGILYGLEHGSYDKFFPLLVGIHL